VKRFWNRLTSPNELETELRRGRPVPPRELADELVARVEADSARRAPSTRPRLALVGVVTSVALISFGATGGLGYAKTAATGAVSSTANAFHAVVQNQPARGGNKHGSDSQKSKPGQSQYQEKVLICHKGHTISVSSSAVPAHLRHGDTVGPC
jgi:hypothetical protein